MNDPTIRDKVSENVSKLDVSLGDSNHDNHKGKLSTSLLSEIK